jgi:hypothetical protein
MKARLAYPNRPPRRTKDVSRRLLWITASRAPLQGLGAGRSTHRSRLGAPGLCPEAATGPASLLAKAISARVHPRVVITASARARPCCRIRHRCYPRRLRRRRPRPYRVVSILWQAQAPNVHRTRWSGRVTATGTTRARVSSVSRRAALHAMQSPFVRSSPTAAA